VDECARLLRPEIGVDLRGLIFPKPDRRAGAADELRDTRWAQPALFTVGYALARLWMSWGIRPAAMIGHSVGECVAATLAGVMDLEDALRLIARRGRLISALPRGSMLAVMATPDVVAPLVGAEVAIAAVNAPTMLVLSGPDGAIERAEAALAAAGRPARRLHTSHAFHSPMMDPILDAFEQAVAAVRLSAPSVPIASTLTAAWAGDEMTQPRYWSGQVRSTVRFGEALQRIVDPDGPAGDTVTLLEVGPGNTLTTFAAEAARGVPCVASLPGPQEARHDDAVLLESLGRLWAGGVAVDWNAFYRNERRARVSLPT
jgi:acyl transferase domain-containing protein